MLARETLANTRAIADNIQAIARLSEGTEQLKRAVDYLMSRDS